MPQTVSGHPPLFPESAGNAPPQCFRLRDEKPSPRQPRSQQASPRHQQPPRPSPRHLGPNHTFSATVMVLVAVSATPAPPCRVSATSPRRLRDVPAASPRRLRDSPRRLRDVSATSPRRLRDSPQRLRDSPACLRDSGWHLRDTLAICLCCSRDVPATGMYVRRLHVVVIVRCRKHRDRRDRLIERICLLWTRGHAVRQRG